ncbi:MAG TPA: hypothetical protein VD905_01790 [Flavobacteriales bacterium]|nr:hypothetical protein [Flavobacteriales bacterium]
MLFFAALTVFTAIIAYLGWRIWKETRQFSFPLGIFFLYYWSLLGAWFLVYDDMTGGAGENFGLHHYVYFKRLFPVNMDGDYFLSITYYALFIVVAEVCILYFVKKKPLNKDEKREGISINYSILLLGACAGIILSIYLVFDQIIVAAETKRSIYTVTRFTENKFFAFHQLLNQAAIIALYIALVAYISGPNGRFIKGGNSVKTYIGLFAATIFIECSMLLLGNKREILFGGVFGMVFYLMNVAGSVNYKKIGIIASFVVIPLFFNDSLRAYSPSFLKGLFPFPQLVEKPLVDDSYTSFSVKNAAFAFLFSNEMFVPHFSMYGVVHKKVPVTYGSSLVYLATSIAPRFIYDNRPEDIYTYYARKVGAKEGQGYTIHHATGWYLNFGIIGIIAGALLLGWIWVKFYFLAYGGKSNKAFVRIFSIIALPCFTAALPSLVRGGPEGYRALFFEYLFIPVFILTVAYLFKLKFGKKT